MDGERKLFEQATRARGEVVVGYVEGALAGGVLCLVRDEQQAGHLGYRAYQPGAGDGSTVLESEVGALEVQAEYSAARQIPGSDVGGAGRLSLEEAIGQSLTAGDRLAGSLPSSDSASLFAVRDDGPRMRVLAGWQAEGGGLVVVPLRLELPTSELISTSSLDVPPVRTSAGTSNVRVEDQTGTKKTHDAERGESPRRRGMMLVAGASVLLIASVVLYVSRTGGPPESPRPLPLPPVKAVPTQLAAAPGALSFDSLGQRKRASVTVLDSAGLAIRPTPAVAWSSSNERVATVAQIGDSVEVLAVGVGSARIVARLRDDSLESSIPVSVSRRRVSDPPEKLGDAGTGRGEQHDVKGPTGPKEPKESRVVKDAPELVDRLDELYRQATDTESRTAAAWRQIAQELVALFPRLQEVGHRQRAATGIVSAYAFAGGSREACRFLPYVPEAIAGVLSAKNACPQ